MGLFDKIKGPVLVKSSSSAEEQLSALTLLKGTVSADISEKIDRDIKLLQTGDFGENSIMFELKNSRIPMMILHDLYLEHGGLTAQIDFLVITRKHIYIIECKNLYGNIEINNRGDFIRTVSGGKKEGFYSPITQNERHLGLIKQMLSDERGNVPGAVLFEKAFFNTYRSVIVLANSKTVLYDKYAEKQVKEKVIRADRLIAYIKNCDAQAQSPNISEKQMQSLSQFFLERHKTNSVDYTSKYRIVSESDSDLTGPVEQTESAPIFDCPEPEKRQQESAPIPACPNPEQPQPESIPVIPTCPEPEQAQTKSMPEPDGDTPEQAEVLCPKCGAAMVKRTAAKGANAGREFYGCSGYPGCRGIVNIQ